MAIPEEGRNGASRARWAMKNHPALASGAVSGIAGGVVMIAFVAIAAMTEGISPAQPLADIGETFIGAEALGVAAKVTLGAILHLATSAAFGIVFAGIVPREFSTQCAMGLGAGVALFAMGFMMSVVVPWVNPGFRAASHLIGGSWVIAHVLYGLTLGMALPLRRWISREASEAAPPRPFVPPRPAPFAPGTRTR